MIEGLHFDISSDQLREHLLSRIEWHRERHEWYKKNASELVESFNRQADPNWVHTPFDVTTGYGASNSRVDNLKDGAKQHLDKVTTYTAFVKYLIPNNTYRLTPHSMAELELIPNGRLF